MSVSNSQDLSPSLSRQRLSEKFQNLKGKDIHRKACFNSIRFHKKSSNLRFKCSPQKRQDFNSFYLFASVYFLFIKPSVDAKSL